jgi:hypothetical protein
MAFDKTYYDSKKQALIKKNQQLTQKFLAGTLDFAREIAEIDNDFQEITKWEQEQAMKKPADPITEGIKETVKNAKKELEKISKK